MADVFLGKCIASVAISTTGDKMFLLRPDPPDGRGSHVIGQLPESTVDFEELGVYEVTFKKVVDDGTTVL